nr:hypothetical protein [Tanacetum cinerariifolium]
MIKNVDPMLDNITVQGRCIFLWHSHKNNEAHNPYNLDMVLQDSQNNRIEVYIKKEWMFRFEPLFQKGIDPLDNNVNSFILESFNRLLDGTRHYHEHEMSLGRLLQLETLSLYNSLLVTKYEGLWLLRMMRIPEYDESQFKIEVLLPQEPVVTSAEFFHGAVKKMATKTHYIVYARIHRLHKENEWAYTACKECNNKVDVVKSKASSSSGKSKVTFYCEEHGAVQVASR